MKKVNLEGVSFNRWKVLRRDINKKGYWICECQCKNKTIRSVSHSGLISGKSKSCGCLHSELTTQRNLTNNPCKRKYNKYDLTGKYGIGYDSNGKEFYFDLEDYDKIKNYTWYVNPNKNYVKTYNKKYIMLHRMILGLENDNKGIVDHINRIPNDCRKSNLRLVSNEENRWNSNNFYRKDNIIAGVYKHRKRWRVRLMCKGVRYNIGSYDNIEDAIKARLEAELIYYGEEFAPQRHLFKKYGITEKNYDNQ